MATANDDAWRLYFENTNTLAVIQKQGYKYVKADELIAYRQPRLMAKLDTLSERPQVFKQNGLNILPVQNGLYVVYQDPDSKLYFKFDSTLEDVLVEEYEAQIDLQSLDSFPVGTALSSESQVIDFAFLASLFRHFCNCETLHLTIRGRLYSGQFDLSLPNGHRIEVSNVQIEVDSGYESSESIILVEAKIGRRSDFNIRQLVYPFLQWSQRSKKKIRPIFLTYSNGEYVFTEFEVGKNFGDLRIVANRAFIINDSPVAVINLTELFRTEAVGVEPPPPGTPLGIPFPQADDMNKVVDLIKLLEKGAASKTAIAEFFEFEERQGDYYANAAAYLGFASRSNNAHGFKLTPLGLEFLALPARSQRTRKLLRQMLQRPSLRQCIELFSERNFDLTKISYTDIASIIVSQTYLSDTASTLPRRVTTVRMWLKWLLKNTSFGQQTNRNDNTK